MHVLELCLPSDELARASLATLGVSSMELNVLEVGPLQNFNALDLVLLALRQQLPFQLARFHQICQLHPLHPLEVAAPLAR